MAVTATATLGYAIHTNNPRLAVDAYITLTENTKRMDAMMDEHATDATPDATIYDRVAYAADYCIGTCDSEQRTAGSTILRLLDILSGVAEDNGHCSEVMDALRHTMEADSYGYGAPDAWTWTDDNGVDVDEPEGEFIHYLEDDIVDAINDELPDAVREYATFGRNEHNGYLCVLLLEDYVDYHDTWMRRDYSGVDDMRGGVTITDDSVTVEHVTDGRCLPRTWTRVEYGPDGLTDYASYVEGEDGSYVVRDELSTGRCNGVLDYALMDKHGHPIIGTGHPCYIAISVACGWTDTPITPHASA